LILLVNNYLPMLGVVIAFKDYSNQGNFIQSIFMSKYVGLKNFEFFFVSPDAFKIIRNTLGYNMVFVLTGLMVPVTFAIALSEVSRKYLAKMYQSLMFLPFFLSWIVVGYLAYSLFSKDMGFVNRVIMEPLGFEKIDWYMEKKYWPFILIFFQLWKYTGYNVVVYLAAISGIDTEFYEAAALAGASKFQQIKHITIPMRQPIMIIMTLLAVGRMFNADFGLFFNVPKNSGALYNVTNVIDTYVYRTMMNTANFGMTAAVGLLQAVLGCITVLAANYAITRIDKESGLF
jgi:putative aldouronate transport system permease protein